MQTAQTMKKLTKIKLINWHYFQNETINIDGSFLLSGENASGKSTILDAIQLVLTTSTKSFNLATTVGEKKSKRDLKGYVRCKTGEEGNTYYRSGSIISYVALEFYEESKDRFFTLGVKIDSPDVESELKKKWFKIESQIDNISFIVNNKPALDDQLLVNGKRVQFILTTSEAKNQFRTRLGHLDENFFEMIPKSIAFKPMDNIKSFINKFILPEKNIDVDTLRENIRNLKELQITLAEVKKQVSKLKDILSKYDELKEIDREIIIIDILAKLAELSEIESKIDDAKNNKVKKDSLLKSMNGELLSINEKVQNLQNRFNEIQVSIKTSDCNQLISKLENELQILENEQKVYNQKMEELLKQLKKCELASSLIDNNMKSSISKDIKSLSSCDIEDEIKIDIVLKIGTEISNEKRKAYNHKSKLSNYFNELNSKSDRLKIEVERLKKNQMSYPENVVKLQQYISKEFSNRCIDSEVRIFADLLEVNEERWQDAIEGYLNTQRFNLIVNPKYYDIATEVYDRHKNEIHTVALVNTGALNLDITVDDNSLASIVSSANQYALAYAREILNRVIKCDNVIDLKKYSISITEGCMLYKGKAVRKINPDVYRVPYIGKYALKKQLDIKTTELNEIEEKIKIIENQLSELDNNIDIYENYNQDVLLQNIDAPRKLNTISSEIKIKNNELDEAKSDPNIIELNNISNRIEGELKLQKELYDKSLAEQVKLSTECENIDKKIDEYNAIFRNIKTKIDEMCLTSANVREEANIKFEEQIKSTKSISKLLDNNSNIQNGLKKEREKKYGSLTSIQAQYRDGELGLGDDEDIILSYSDEFDNLSKHNLVKCEEKLEKAQNACEEEFRENFLSKMRENIENAKDIFSGLNKSLKDIKYGQDSYKFVLKPNQVKEGLYKMITSDINIGGQTLFSKAFEEEYHVEMEDLFSKLTESDTTGDSILKEYTDYRGYLDYDIEVNSNGKLQLFSKIYGEKSGGETQTPYYVAIAASFTQMYSIGESIRILILDEAFDKMDDERIASMMTFFKEQKFQVILATPPAKMEIIGEYVDDIFVVYREGYNSFIEAYQL